MGTLDDLLDAALPGRRERLDYRQAEWWRQRRQVERLVSALNAAGALPHVDADDLLLSHGWRVAYISARRWEIAEEPAYPRE